MAITFNIFEGVNTENGTDKISDSENKNQQQDLLESTATGKKKKFIPRTPDSAKIERGERNKLVQKMIDEVKKQVAKNNPQINNETNNPSPTSTDNFFTEFKELDPDIQNILHENGIFYFYQIPEYIKITYGSLLSSNINDDELVRLNKDEQDRQYRRDIYLYQDQLK